MLQIGKKYNISVIISAFPILVLGSGLMTALGLHPSSNGGFAFLAEVSYPTRLMFLTLFFWIVKRRISFYVEEQMMVLSCIIYVVISGCLGASSNFMILINVFLSLAALSLLFKNTTNIKSSILNIVLLYYFIECSVAILERVLQKNFFSIEQEMTFLDIHVSSISVGFRSASLHSHPLQGALMVCVVMSFIFVSNYKPIKKIGMLFVGLLALFAFNTRSSIVYWSVMISLYFGYLILFKTTKAKYKIIGFVLLVIALVAIGRLINQGWAGRLVELSLYDQGSAGARINVLNVLKDFSFQHYLLGVPKEFAMATFKRNGVYIMENYWISYIMNWGLPFTCWLVYCAYRILKCYMLYIPKRKRYFPLVTFLLISSTNNSMMTGVPALLLLLCGYYGFGSCNENIFSMSRAVVWKKA